MGARPHALTAMQGAGGKITDWRGQPLRWEVTHANQAQAVEEFPGEVLAAGDAGVHAAALALLGWGQ